MAWTKHNPQNGGDSDESGRKGALQKTFTFRAFCIGVVAMVGMGMWIHFHEVLLPRSTPIGENSPATAAVGIFLGLLLVGGAVSWLRPRLRLRPAELAVIYAMLVTSAPLMSQGMWHRFLGLVVAIPHESGNMELVDSYSDKLWPHGRQLLADHRFENGLGPQQTVAPAGSVEIVSVENSPIGPARAAELRVVGTEGTAREPSDAVMRWRVPRYRDGREILVPGERYYFAMLCRTEALRTRSRFTVELVSDGGERIPLVTVVRDTEATYSSPGAFKRDGQPYVDMPRDLKEHVDLVFTMKGPGRAAFTDIRFFSNEALARLHKGSSEVAAGDLARLAANERDSIVVRPDKLGSPAGIWYTLKGYIPYGQWAVPAFYWASLVLAIFLCLFGISVIFRRQWADNERFPFPLVVVPRLLIEEQSLERRRVLAAFRSRAFLIGAAFALVYTLLLGLAHYVPGIPSPQVSVELREYVASPALKAFLKGMHNSRFTIMLTFVAIAFFIDLDMLLSMLIFFWLAKVPFYFGEIFGWKTIKGTPDYYAFKFPFPHEQHIGAFLGLALIVFWISRKHLLGVGRRVLGLAGGIDDRGEAMRYRAAVGLILACLVFFGVWGRMTGMGVGSSLIFFSFLIVCGLSAARIRTEAGLPWTYFTPYFPYLIFFLLGGLPVFGTKTMVLAYCLGGFMAVAQFLLFAPTQVEMLELGNQVGGRPTGIKWGLIAGVLGGIFIGGYVMLVWYYGKGGENLPYTYPIKQDWYIGSLRTAVNQADIRSLATGGGKESLLTLPSLAAVSIGGGLTVLLTFLRTHFVGFWLHPIGYVLANTHFMYACWGSILVAWIIKAAALKIAGPRFVREQMIPGFVGVFCGSVVGVIFWDIVALFAAAQGVRDIYSCWP